MKFQTKSMPRKGWEYISTVLSKTHLRDAVIAD